MRLNTLLEKDEEKKKVVFVETDPQLPFPENTISALEKNIKTNAKNLEKNWKNVIELTNNAFTELDVPLPQAFLKERWKQYQDLLNIATEGLIASRGMKSDWNLTI